MARVTQRRMMFFEDPGREAMARLVFELNERGFADSAHPDDRELTLVRAKPLVGLWGATATVIRLEVILNGELERRLRVIVIETGDFLDETIKILTTSLGDPL